MIRPHSPRPERLHRCDGAFTLIELLTVIAIILVLAGLLLNIAGNANYKSSFARAQTEVKAMETALEGYKADNGAYPRILPSSVNANPPGTSVSDTLNAQSDTDPGGTAKTKYQGADETIYQALSGITGFDNNANPSTPIYGGKKYMELKSSQLDDAGGGSYTTPSATTIIIDPFGLPYGYSTIYVYTQENNGDTSSTGYNPTFDLWSTGGYGAGGKSYPNPTPAPSSNVLWAKNW